jgi:nitrate reductase gamma subunit
MAGVIFGIVAVGVLFLLGMINNLKKTKPFVFRNVEIDNKRKHALLFGAIAVLCFLAGFIIYTINY